MISIITPALDTANEEQLFEFMETVRDEISHIIVTCRVDQNIIEGKLIEELIVTDSTPIEEIKRFIDNEHNAPVLQIGEHTIEAVKFID